MFIDNTGKRINIDVPFTDPDTGRKGIRLTDPAERERYGITEIPEPERKNEEFYYVQTLDEAPYVLNTSKPLDMVKVALCENVKTHRDTLIFTGGCAAAGKWFHSDTHSKMQQMALYNLGANIPAGLQWKTMDGSFIEMTPLVAGDLFIGQIMQEQLIFATGEAKQTEINALDTIEALEAYDVLVGWPLVYSDMANN